MHSVCAIHRIGSILLGMMLIATLPLCAVSAQTQERNSLIEQRTAMHRLHAAVRIGDIATIVSILESGVDANASDAMQLAILFGRKDIVDVLIEHGADINRPSMVGEPPVITALKHGRIEMMKHLVGKGADLNGRDLSGKTALHYARQRAEPVVINYLKANGALEEPATLP